MNRARSHSRRKSFEIDLSKVPDDVLLAESARRLRARQATPPRAKVLRQCPHCLKAFGAREMRSHIPACRRRSAEHSAHADWKLRKIADSDDQDAQTYRYWQSRSAGERIVATWELTEAAYSIKRAG